MTAAAQAFHGTKFLVNNSNDVLSPLGHGVFGSPLDKLLIICVLTSASASTQTTILPDRADDAVDGALGGDPEGVRPRPPALLHADRLDRA